MILTKTKRIRKKSKHSDDDNRKTMCQWSTWWWWSVHEYTAVGSDADLTIYIRARAVQNRRQQRGDRAAVRKGRQRDRQATKQTRACHVPLERSTRSAEPVGISTARPPGNLQAPVTGYRVQFSLRCVEWKAGRWTSSNQEITTGYILKRGEENVSSPLHFVIWSWDPASQHQSLMDQKTRVYVLAMIGWNIKQMSQIQIILLTGRVFH